jgi:translation initiation factor 1 (eIF-1/SUI1)
LKLILETQELEAIVKENIAAKYPDNNISVSIQNKRNGIEVTVVLTEKLAEKEIEDCVDDKDYVDDE